MNFSNSEYLNKDSLKRIIQFQEEKFNSKADFARAIGVYPQRISAIKNGTLKTLSIEELRLLYENGADLNYIFGLTDSPKVINGIEINYDSSSWKSKYFTLLEKHSELQGLFIQKVIDTDDK